MSGRTLNIGVPLPEFVDTDEQAQDFLHLCLKKIERDKGDFLGFDTETTGKKMPFTVGNKKPLDWMSDTITFWSMSFRDGDLFRRWCIRGEHFQYFAPVLENPDAWFACWNAKYDAHVSWNMGINIWNAHIIDGLALAGLHDENKISRGLKSCAASWCGLHMTPYTDLFGKGVDARGKKIKEYETSLYDLPIDKVVDYASYDAYAHVATVLWLRDRLIETPISREQNLWQYFLEFEIHMTKVLWRMERRGIPVDEDYLKGQTAEIDRQIAEQLSEVNRMAGRPTNVQAPAQLANLFFGPPESGGLGLAPVKMTGSGRQASVDEEVLELLDASDVPLVKPVLRSRKLYKTKSTYLETLVALAEYHQDGRIHPNFNQFGARTGRFSTDAPNSMNFPRPDGDEFGIRKAFIAPPGCKLTVSDYEQLEMRIMAHMSRDAVMIDTILQGKDLHSFTVSRMVPGVTYEEVVAAKKAKEPDERQRWLKRLRQDNKAVGFGLIYGAREAKIATEIDIPEEEVQERLEAIHGDQWYEKKLNRKLKNNPLLTVDKAWVMLARESIARDKIDAYFQTFPGVKSYMDLIPEECRTSKKVDFWHNPRDWRLGVRTPGALALTQSGHTRSFGFVQTVLGRYRRLEDIDHTSFASRSEAERQAVNTTIQGSAADLIKSAMLRIEFNPLLNDLGVEMTNQIHDELVCICPEENAEEAGAEIKECMEHPFEKGKDPLVVPTPVDLRIVDRWSEAKD